MNKGKMSSHTNIDVNINEKSIKLIFVTQLSTLIYNFVILKPKIKFDISLKHRIYIYHFPLFVLLFAFFHFYQFYLKIKNSLTLTWSSFLCFFF